MKTVTVDKNDLIEVLKTNREKHVGTFHEVLEAYRREAVKQLEEHIERIKNGAVEQVRVWLPVPENYEAAYDRAIAMLEWEQGDTVELEQSQFDTYILDQWSWKQDFEATSAAYTQA